MEQNESPTKSLVVKFLEHLGAGNAEGVGGLFADEIDWHVPGNDALPWIGRRSSPLEVVQYLETMWSHLAGPGSSVLDTILIDENEAVVFATISNGFAKTGLGFETPVAMRFTVWNGRFTKMHLFEDSWAVSNAYLG